MLAAPSLASAEPSLGDRKPRPPITLSSRDRGGLIKRPKVPCRQSITCTYDGMTMELNFTISEGTSTLTVIDETPQCFTYTIDTSPLYVSIPVGSLSGSITIELYTERGTNFTGIMEE